MKRLICAILFVVLLAPLGMGHNNGEPILGVVTYKLDARTRYVQDYAQPLNEEVSAIITLYDTSPATFGARIALAEKMARLSIAVQQIDLLKELVTKGYQGIVLTPAPPAMELNPLKNHIETSLMDFPLVLAERRVEGVDLPYFGVSAYDLGVAWAEAISQYGSRPFAVIGYFIDPMQADFLEGLKTSPHFRDAYQVIGENGQDEASAAMVDHPDLSALIVTDPSMIEGALEITQYVKDKQDKFVRLGSFGAPDGWIDLMDQGLLQGMAIWSHFQVLRQASAALADHIKHGMPLMSTYVDVDFYGPGREAATIAFPYGSPEAYSEFWK